MQGGCGFFIVEPKKGKQNFGWAYWGDSGHKKVSPPPGPPAPPPPITTTEPIQMTTSYDSSHHYPSV